MKRDSIKFELLESIKNVLRVKSVLHRFASIQQQELRKATQHVKQIHDYDLQTKISKVS